MTPSRPVGTSRKERWQQWVHDSLKELMPKSGPGVLTDFTTRGTLQRIVRKGRGQDSLYHLPVLRPEDYWIGYWYDANGVFHLWNTVEVEHDGKRWARWANPGWAGLSGGTYIPGAGPNSGPPGIASSLNDPTLPASAQANLEVIITPASQWILPAGVVGLDQNYDIEIMRQSRNFGLFFAFSVGYLNPPTSNIIFQTVLGIHIYENGNGSELHPFPSLTLPY